MAVPRLPNFSVQKVADQTAEFLRDAIRSGRWRGCLPSERALALELRVSRPTLRKAMAGLEREGMLAKTRRHSRRILTRSAPEASRAKTVALLTRQDDLLKDWQGMMLIETIRRQLADEGIRLELFFSEKLHRTHAPDFLEKIASQYAPQAWILQSQTGAVQHWFMAQGLQTVVLGSAFPEVSLPFVDIDRRAICRHSLGVFARLGHRRFCYFSRATNAAGDFLSELAFEESRPLFKAVDIQVVQHDGSAEQMWKEARRWRMQGAKRPTALMTSHWDDALSLVVELLKMGIRVPLDVSIISRDPSPVFKRMQPRIASYFFDPSRHANVLCRVLRAGKATGQWLIPKFDNGESLAHPPGPQHSTATDGKIK